MNKTFQTSSQYFSGQGVVMIGSRDAVTGRPLGLAPLGNCPSLKVDVATTVIDHKGSQDGQRSIDFRLQTETKATASLTLDNWSDVNLAQALRGNQTQIVAGAQTDEAVIGYPGLVMPFEYINISDLVLTANGASLTPYVNDSTPYDYQENDSAGSFMLNNGSSTPVATLGAVATAVTVGATTAITVPNSSEVGDQVYLQGFTGAGAAALNGVWANVTAASATAISVDIDTTEAVITVGATSIVFDPSTPVPVSAAYSYSKQALVDALTQPLTEVYLRFEGLNTADSNSPVIVELFKFSTDPLKELALLTDTYGTFDIEGALLADPLRTTGSQYFQIKQLN